MTSRPAVPDSETPDGPIEVWHFARGPHGVKDAWVSETDYRSLERRLSLAQTEIKGHMRVKDDLEAEVIMLNGIIRVRGEVLAKAQARIAELELQLAASDTVMFNLSEEMKILKSRA